MIRCRCICSVAIPRVTSTFTGCSLHLRYLHTFYLATTLRIYDLRLLMIPRFGTDVPPLLRYVTAVVDLIPVGPRSLRVPVYSAPATLTFTLRYLLRFDLPDYITHVTIHAHVALPRWNTHHPTLPLPISHIYQFGDFDTAALQAPTRRYSTLRYVVVRFTRTLPPLRTPPARLRFLPHVGVTRRTSR